MGVVNASSGVKAGTVAHFAASSAPAGWIKANGAAISRTAYAALFAAIGTTYGVGDGSTTFNVPDLRGEFVRSLDDGRGVDSGRGIGTAQGHQMQYHNHNSHTGSEFPYYGRPGIGAAGPSGLRYDGLAITGPAGGTSNGSENRPRNVAMLACIKY